MICLKAQRLSAWRKIRGLLGEILNGTLSGDALRAVKRISGACGERGRRVRLLGRAMVCVAGFLGFRGVSSSVAAPYAAAAASFETGSVGTHLGEEKRGADRELAEQRSRAFLKQASEAQDNGDIALARTLLERVYVDKKTPEPTRAAAYLMAARGYNEDGHPASWAKARDACLGVLELERAEDSLRTEARELMVPALLNLGKFVEAKRELEVLVSNGMLPELRVAGHLIRLARNLILERSYEEGWGALERAGRILETAAQVDQRVLEELAEVELLRGICFAEGGDMWRAKAVFEGVPLMAGQAVSSSQTREARLRLGQLKMTPEDGPVLHVLFIGSSHTLRGNVPYLVEQLAESATAGVPRVRAGEYVRTGTGMRAFWEEGDNRFTARGRIAAAPWDVVVVETFFRNDPQTMESYARKYASLVAERGARLVVYETPVAKEAGYPEVFAAFHAENVRLGGVLSAVRIAPSVRAWMQFLGEHPSPQEMSRLYADWIHATLEGAYLTACCIYAALTGASPVGLAHPEEIRDEEATTFQKIAWDAFVETRAAVER